MSKQSIKLMTKAYYMQAVVVSLFLAPLLISIVQCISGEKPSWAELIIDQAILVGFAFMNMHSYKRDIEHMEWTDKMIEDMRESYQESFEAMQKDMEGLIKRNEELL